MFREVTWVNRGATYKFAKCNLCWHGLITYSESFPFANGVPYCNMNDAEKIRRSNTTPGADLPCDTFVLQNNVKLEEV